MNILKVSKSTLLLKKLILSDSDMVTCPVLVISKLLQNAVDIHLIGHLDVNKLLWNVSQHNGISIQQ